MLPAVSLGLWHNFGGDTPHETKRAICRAAFDAGITHFDLANNYGPPPGSAETAFGEILRTDFAGLPRRAHHLDQGRLPDVARPLRRVGEPQVPARLARPEPEAHGPRLRRHLLLPPLRPRHAARGDHGRARHRRPLRPGALRRPLLLQLGEDPRGRGDPEGPRHPLRHPPAELQHDQPLGGARRAEGDAEGARHRLDRLHAAGAGDADGQVPQGHPRGQPRHPGQVAAAASSSTTAPSPTSASSTRSPRRAARPSPRWRSPGCCATAASPRR